MSKKLNMLEPGGWFCLAIVGLAAAGTVSFLAGWRTAAGILWGIDGLVTLVFVVLLVVEHHQDRRQYERAKKHNFR